MAQKKLTPKQERFCQEYLVDLNATQAAIRAGYAKKAAYAIGAENLRKPQIAEAISEGRKSLADKAGVTAEAVVAELAKLGFSNMEDFMEVDDGGRTARLDLSALTREQAAAIKELTVEETLMAGQEESGVIKRTSKLKLADKQAALTALGKHLGLFPTKVEHSGPDGEPLPRNVQITVVGVRPS